ncbi:MAG: oligosaccharide flippase family protein [Anaerobutyricum soehngenii]
MSYKTSYKKTIFTGTLILTLSGFLARILGFYNRIFLSNLIGAKELGIYQLIFPVYMLCFSLCCHGFETGISNFTSRFFAKGQKRNAHRLVKLGCLLSFFLSIILMFFLFEGADYLSTFILKRSFCCSFFKNRSSLSALCVHKSLSPWLLHRFEIALVYPAVSQIVEQITRVGSIYFLSVTIFILGADARIAAWGMVLGEGVSTFYTILAYFRTYFLENRNSLFHKKAIFKKKNTKKRADTHRSEPALIPAKKLFFHFFSFSLPISINHFSLTVISSLETMLNSFYA